MLRRGTADYLFSIVVIYAVLVSCRDCFGISFVETQVIQPAIPTPFQDLGYSLAANGNLMLAGAINDNNGSTTVYQRDAGGLWNPVTKLLPSDPLEIGFGAKLGYDGNSAIVSCIGYYVTPSVPGGVYIFQRGAANNWTQSARFAPPTKLDSFGRAVDIDGSVGVASGLVRTGPTANQGYVEVYKQVAAGTWAQSQEIAVGSPDSFVSSLALQNGTLMVGSTQRSGGTTLSMVNVYANTSAGFVYFQTLNVSDKSGDFGSAISFGGTRLLVGANGESGHGAGYIFDRDSSGQWVESARLVPPDVNQRFFIGGDVALDGDFAFLPSYNTSTSLSGGRVDVFHRDTAGNWTDVGNFASSSSTNDFGYTLIANRGDVMVSSDQNMPGMIHIFSQVPEPASMYYAIGMLGCIVGRRRRFSSRHD